MAFIKITTLILWIVISIISINHLYSLVDLKIPMYILGIIGWLSYTFTSIFLSRAYIKQSLLIFFVFFGIGYFTGPYLEPPADTLAHLQRVYLFSNNNGINIPKTNRGLWHYSMVASILCLSNKQKEPGQTLNKIFILHGLFFTFSMVGLFVLSKSSGLPDRWAYFSMIMALLFMGTNRFSYFTYYSFGPTFSSIQIYWIWTALFFFKRKARSIITGLSIFLLSIPIFMVNHLQETFFLAQIVSVWLLLNGTAWFWPRLNQAWKKLMFVMAIITILFIIPQFSFFHNSFALWKKMNFWNKNQPVIFYLGGIQVIGKIWRYRVSDTLGIMGAMPLFLSVFFFWPKLFADDIDKKLRLFILGIMPFIGYCIPFYHVIWLSNCNIHIYYRLAYSSIFWVTIVYVLFQFEAILSRTWRTEKVGTTRIEIEKQCS